MNTSKIVVSEASIRNIAQNLKNLFRLAEAQNYPFDGFVFPSQLSVLNAVSQTFGFKSVKGMSVHLEGDLEIEKDPSEVLPINLDVAIRNKNTGITGVRFYEAKHLIQILFTSLINQPISKVDEQLLARLKKHQLNPIATQLIFMAELKTYRVEDLLISDLIKVAQYSNTLYHSHLSKRGMPEVLGIEQQLDFNAERSQEFIQDWNNALHMHMEKSGNHNISDIINSHSFGVDQFKAHYNPNQNFVESMVVKLRTELMTKLMASKGTQSSAGLMYKYNQSALRGSHHPADEIQARIYQANIKVINAITAKTDAGVDDFKQFELDAYGLLTPNFFAVLLQIHRLGNKGDYEFSNLNTLYWIIQKLSADVLRKNDNTGKAAAKYIDDIYENFIPVVQEHFTEVHNKSFHERYIKVSAALKSKLK